MKKRMRGIAVLLCMFAGSVCSAYSMQENKKEQTETSVVPLQSEDTQEPEDDERIEKDIVQQDGIVPGKDKSISKIQTQDLSKADEKEQGKEKKDSSPTKKTEDKGVVEQTDTAEKAVADTQKEKTETKAVKKQESTEKAATPAPTKESVTVKEEVHVHTWEEIKTLLHHEAVTQQVWVEDVAAWTEEVPVYEEKEQPVCVTCGMDIEGNPNAHLNAVCRQWRNEVRSVLAGTETIFHEAQGHYETQTIQEAYEEWTVTGSMCPGCGAVR